MNSQNHKRILTHAKLRITIRSNANSLDAARIGMLPETRAGKKCRFSVTKRRKGVIMFEFDSDELSPLRASMNTNLRLFSSALKTIEAVAETK